MDRKTTTFRKALHVKTAIVVGCTCIFACLLYYSLPLTTTYRIETVKENIGQTVKSNPQLLPPTARPQRPSFVRGKRNRLPHCIVIGAKKAGTRALLTFLDLHPDVVTCPVEAHFFDEFYQRGMAFYRHQMPPSYDHQISVEKTARYFHLPDVPERVHRFNSSIRLLLIVRDPVERIISHYAHVSSHKALPPSLESKLLNEDGNINVSHDYVNISSYYTHLTRWLSYFELDQIHVLDGAELVKEPFNAIADVETFLGLRNYISKDMFYFNETKGFYCYLQNGQDQCLGDNKGRQHPVVSPNIVEQLKDYFAPLNEKLFSLINKRFNW